MRLVFNRYNIDNSYPKKLFSKLRDNYPEEMDYWRKEYE